MSDKKQKREVASKGESRAQSLLLLESREGQKRLASMVARKEQQKSRCLSIKEGARSCLVSAKRPKIEQGKKKKANNKRKPIIAIS